MDDRRQASRFTIWFPVALGTQQRETWAICRDASQRGILISSRSTLEVGARVSVTFRVSPEDESDRVVEGRVVRIENAKGASPWPHDIAIEFDEPLPELDAQLARRSQIPPAP